MSSYLSNLRFSDRQVSEVSADPGDETFTETFTETKSCAIGRDGIRINYDLDTITPKYFEMTKDGVVFQETGQPTYTTGLGRLCAVQQAFQAVELPPNATTLKLNDTLLLDAGVANQSTTITDGTAIFSNAGVGGLSNPQLTLTNSNATINTIPTIEMNKTGRNLTAGESVGSISMYGLDAGTQKTEFARIQVKTENVAIGNEDGTLSVYNSVNGVISETFNFNGGQNENNSFRPLDMNGNALRTTTTNLTLDATASSGTGNIIIAPKTATGGIVDIQGDTTLTGTRQATFGGGTNITNIINRTGLLIQNVNTQSIYQDANCNLVETDTPNNSLFTNTNTPKSQLIRRIDLTSGNDVERNLTDLNQTKLEYTDSATGDQSTINVENDLASLNNVIIQNFTTGAGAVLETILQTTPYGQHRLSMTNNNSGFSTILSTNELEINDTGNNKSITIDNNPSSIQNRIDLFKNDGGGISTQLAIANTTGNQILSLAHTDNANNKVVSISNNRGGSVSLDFNNTIDTAPLDITSNQSLNLTATGAIGINSQANTDITSAGGNINLNCSTGTTTFTTSALDFTGASLQSNTSSGNSGEHLVITLNGVQYKIALQNP